MLDFTPSGHRITSFASSAELNASLTDASPPPYHVFDQLPRRRLFILEDLPRNFILALGTRLLIPPSFFAGHWDDPASSTFNHRNPFQINSLPNFRIRYATSNRVEVDTSSLPGYKDMAGMYAFNTNVCRYLHTYSPGGLLYDEARSHHIMSFWVSTPREDGSWDAVLLVDPPPTEQVRCLRSKKLLPLRRRLLDETLMPKHFLNPDLDFGQELSTDSSTWASSHIVPQYLSIYNDILDLYCSASTNIINTCNPLGTVEIPRKLVMSTLLAFVRRRYLNIVNVHKGLGAQSLRHNYLASFSNSNMSSWSNEFFDFMVGSCAAMKEFSREVEENIIALGLDKPQTSTAPWETDGWKSICDLTHVVEEMTNTFATNYLQYVTIREAHASNGSAQSLSRITVLTMLFIPLSTVASIFSMGGDFLPGETKAWMFWVVAVPVLAVLAYVYWHRKITTLWRFKKQQLLPSFELRLSRSKVLGK
jgi:hypothetical protein